MGLVEGLKKKIITSAERVKLSKAVFSDTTGITGATSVINIVKLSQVQYDALGSYNANTFYIIV